MLISKQGVKLLIYLLKNLYYVCPLNAEEFVDDENPQSRKLAGVRPAKGYLPVGLQTRGDSSLSSSRWSSRDRS